SQGLHSLYSITPRAGVHARPAKALRRSCTPAEQRRARRAESRGRRAISSLQLLPQSLEPASGNARVVHGMPRVAVAEVVLHGAQVRAFVGQVEAAGVPKRVGMDVLEAGAVGGGPDQVVDRLPRHGLAALGDEQPRELVGARGEVALDGAQL